VENKCPFDLELSLDFTGSEDILVENTDNPSLIIFDGLLSRA